ncbi:MULTISPECIES: ThiF family adenylyltransferase [Paenibacillus]|uniref:ThiF family adenylyltransferase n=1 Tax=Paenibacillus TaxID=44249 RepID=UPI000C9FC167|nr:MULTISPECIES: ThiF family adenylyltransferase [Paenibacillus]KAF6581972.1 ThiF family adenylyltransferase [Paenibacillus sp. EKM211P]KAF6616378.1 ThiF family adenylyltransferase [Paenibacillus sp. EKM101P]KAF6623677.1 ThiF family adenylyltransferase [Paenibacillus sp. EKM102P]KAF6633760.1 ThiF family adenylyltransferase [Paenibacillus sp. EKM10P]KAF6649286.1 ThiF family adenylyltransferase [Paenibacillus sp. EKM11P]
MRISEKSGAGTPQIDRYSRQERFAPFGPAGQRRLASSHVLIIGVGALGTGIAETLVRGGVGTVSLVDRDYVEWSNLQRQQLFQESDAAQRCPKAIAAQRRLKVINSQTVIHAHVLDVGVEELEELIQGVDLMMDATDNFDTRLLMNDMALKHHIPWIYGGCVGSYGVTYTFLPGQTPCLHCLMGTVPFGGETCDTAGIIPQAVQMVTANQTTEAFKLLGGYPEDLRGKLLSFDLWKNEYVAIAVDRLKKSNCPSCGSQPTYPYLSTSHRQKTDVLCGRDTVQIRPANRIYLNLAEIADRFAALGEGNVEWNSYLVSFSVGEHRLVVFADGRALIHGTKDVAKARSLYHRYLG